MGSNEGHEWKIRSVLQLLYLLVPIMQYHQLDGAQLYLLPHVLFNMVFQLEEEKKIGGDCINMKWSLS